MGQTLMTAIASFPAPVYAAIPDTARAAVWTSRSPAIIASHLLCGFCASGSGLGLITGGEARSDCLADRQGRRARMLVAAEKVTASQALRMRLVDRIAADPVGEALHRIAQGLWKSVSIGIHLAALRGSARAGIP